MSQSTSDFLNKIPAFQGLAEEELVDLLRTLQPISYQAGEIIFRENDDGEGAFIIQEGKIEIFISDAKKSLTVTRLHAGEIFGELALIDGAPRSAGARTLTQCELLFIEKREFPGLKGASENPVFSCFD